MVDSDGHQGPGPDERCQQPEQPLGHRLHRVLQCLSGPHGPDAGVLQLAEPRYISAFNIEGKCNKMDKNTHTPTRMVFYSSKEGFEPETTSKSSNHQAVHVHWFRN